jgi:hypothetical protein
MTKLWPFVETQWHISTATRSGRCSLSGIDISVGDSVYTTSEPALSHYQVLVLEYERYELSVVRRHQSEFIVHFTGHSR